ncbi:hypothetical protein ON058_11025, partial [Demequina sp. B12]|uniref:hypothetical protein n=1 Tax=Demequina sp. B12 TaxID=2992757 RepID=UPI00237B779B
WNYSCGPLWSNTVRVLRRRMPSAEYFGGWEFQERGARHIHLILRIHHRDALAEHEILESIQPVTTRDHHGRVVRWGRDLHIKRLTRRDGLPANAFRDNRRARILNYLLKAVGYTVKDTQNDPTWTSPDVNAHFTRLDLAAHHYKCTKCQPGIKCASLIHRRWGARSRVVLASRSSHDNARPGWSPRKMTRRKQAEHRRNYQRLQDLRNLPLYRPHLDAERFKQHIRDIRS